MHFHSWQRKQPKRLARPVQEYMRQRFDLVPEYLAMLRCFEYDGLLNEKQIRCTRIFNPYLVQRQHTSIRTAADLD